jgi:hypothetical protein
MKLRVVGMLAAFGVAAFSLGAEPAALAKGKAKKEAAPAAPTGPAKFKGKLVLSPKGLSWGDSVEMVAKLYDKEFDKEFLPLYKKAQPGPQMQSLDAELADKKALIRRNKIEFGSLPTGVDQSPLNGEYSYMNGEMMSKVKLRSGVMRNFFFFKNKLWKIYDEHKLRKGGPYGENWEEAVKIITKKYGGVEPYTLEPDYAKGRNYPEAQWQDGGSTVIRAINREPMIGLVYQDANVYFNLSKYRVNKPKDPNAIDKDVAAATSKPEPPKPKDEPKTKGKKKGK